MRTPNDRHVGLMKAGRAFLVLVSVAVFGAGIMGQAGRFTDSAAGKAVLDTQTKLMWEKKDRAGGLHDAGKTYDWCQATGGREGLCKNNTTSWIAQVNAERFGGFNDWRVPTDKELISIVSTSAAKCGSGSPCIDPMFGPTIAFHYWASTEPRRTSRGSVDFYFGKPLFDFELNKFHVRAVRGGQ